MIKVALIALAIMLALPALAIAVWLVLGRFESFRAWKLERVRAKEFGSAPDFPYYVRFTPNFGLGLPWFNGERLRIAPHHGVQVVRRATSGRWCVKKQLLLKSKVKGERFMGLDEKVKARTEDRIRKLAETL